jgi:WD40 repeat protein
MVMMLMMPLLVRYGRDCIKSASAHEGPVLSLVGLPGGSGLVTASNDATIKLWDNDLILTK